MLMPINRANESLKAWGFSSPTAPSVSISPLFLTSSSLLHLSTFYMYIFGASQARVCMAFTFSIYTNTEVCRLNFKQLLIPLMTAICRDEVAGVYDAK